MTDQDPSIMFHSRITVREEMAEPFLASISRLFDRVVDVPACEFAYLVQATRDPLTFMLLERWSDREALEEWKQTEAFRAYWAQTEPMYAEGRIDQGWRVLRSKPA